MHTVGILGSLGVLEMLLNIVLKSRFLIFDFQSSATKKPS